MNILNNAFNLANPFSDKYFAIRDFEKITTTQKVKTVVAALLATIVLATVPIFRLMVARYVQQLHPEPSTNPPADNPEAKPITPPITPPKTLPKITYNFNDIEQSLTASTNSTLPAVRKVKKDNDNADFKRIDLNSPEENSKQKSKYSSMAIILFDPKPPLFRLGFPEPNSHSSEEKNIISPVDENPQISIKLSRPELGTSFKDPWKLSLGPNLFDRLFNQIPFPLYKGLSCKLNDKRPVRKLQFDDAVLKRLKNLRCFDEMNGISFSKLIPNYTTPDKLGLTHNNSNFLSYIYQPLEGLENSDFISFDLEKKQIIAVEDRASQQQGFQIFWNLVKETYGEPLAIRVFGRYFYRENSKEIKDSITLEDLKMVLAGLAANVKLSDLKNLFNAIRDADIDKYKMIDSMNKLGAGYFSKAYQLYHKINNDSKFENLSSEDLYILYLTFMNYPTENGGLQDIRELTKDVESTDFIYKQDAKALMLRSTWQNLDETSPKEALAELVGKNYAYFDLTEGMILPLPSFEKGKWKPHPSLHVVAASLKRKGDAVIAHILEPVLEADKKQGDIHLIFRGTQAGDNEIEGNESLFGRDFEVSGVGRESYQNRDQEIEIMLETYLKNRNEDSITLHISGHSLGGVDVQRALVTVTRNIINSPGKSPWKKLKNLEVITFNAPRVNQTCSHDFKNMIRQIKDSHKGKNGSKIDLKINLNHVRFYNSKGEDFIQNFGGMLIGADMQGDQHEGLYAACNFFSRKLTEIRVDDPTPDLLSAHSYRPYNRALMGELQFERNEFNINELEEGEKARLEKYMAGNYYWDSTKHGLFANVHWGLGRLGKYLLKDPLKAFGVTSIRLLVQFKENPDLNLNLRRAFSFLMEQEMYESRDELPFSVNSLL